MAQIKDLASNVNDYILALAYSHHVDKRELYQSVVRIAQAQADRLAALDPDRNR